MTLETVFLVGAANTAIWNIEGSFYYLTVLRAEAIQKNSELSFRHGIRSRDCEQWHLNSPRCFKRSARPISPYCSSKCE